MDMNVDIDIYHGPDMQHGNGHAAWKRTSIRDMGIDMQHEI
jgi:hypothetical protein